MVARLERAANRELRRHKLSTNFPVRIDKPTSASLAAGYRIDALQQRDAQIAVLAAKTPADSFKGSWLAGTRYRRGESVQKGNATYMCLTDTDEQPGHSSSWRLSSGR